MSFTEDLNFLQSLVDAHQEPFCLVATDYRIVAANQRYADAYAGSDRNAIIGKKCHQVSHKSDKPCEAHEECPLRQVFATGQAHQFVHRHYDQFGEPDYVTVRGNPIFDANGMVVLMGENITSISHGQDICLDAERMVSGCCPSFMRVLDNLVTVAETEAPVLILGETGTGKEMAARFIHDKSRRANKEFVVVDCTQFTDDRFASDLFGHIRGAFTGAMENKLGLYEIADRGTLVLDEIGELSPAIQVRLLRVLETGTFRRLGETRERRADVRLVCATNRDLAEMVRSGTFRADLYHRINCMQVELPPLRHRLNDLAELSIFFLERVGHRAGMSDATHEVLLRYEFPGNIRELRNILERAALLAQGARIEPRHLPDDITAGKPSCHTNPVHASEASVACPEPELDEARHLREVLARHRGNRRLAALELGISERTLYRKLKAQEAGQ